MTVRQCQHLLAYLGYYSGGIDGIWGSQSQEGMRQFQQDFGGLPVNGTAGPESEEALKAAVSQGMPPKEDFWAEIRWFQETEFRCKCGGRYCDGYPARMQREVVLVADRAREYFGAPGHVISGLRCPQHNAASGGVANSRHMTGAAIDLRIDGVSAQKLLDFVKQQPEIRYAYAINGTNVHLDVPGKAG